MGEARVAFNLTEALSEILSAESSRQQVGHVN